MFSSIDNCNEIFNNYILNNFNNNLKILEYLNLSFISISGSTILQIIQNKFYNNSDLDIYIDSRQIINNEYNQNKLKEFIFFLKDNYFYKNQLEIELDTIYQILNIPENNQSNEYVYANISNNIEYVFSLNSKKINTINKIDIIFLQCDIETHLINDYDLNIVKNYWKNNKIYSLDKESIYNKIAKIDYKKIKNTILLSTNLISFNNTMKRCIKYLKRGFKIFLNKNVELTLLHCEYLLNLYKFICYSLFKCNRNRHGRFTLINNIRHKNYYIKLNNNMNVCVNIKQHILSYLNILILIRQYKIKKQLTLYSYHLLNNYLNPNSKYLIYKINTWDNEEENKNKKIALINSSNELIFLQLK